MPSGSERLRRLVGGAALLATLAATGACVAPTTTARPYAVVFNGGVGPQPVACDPDEVVVVLTDASANAYVGATVPGCSHEPAVGPVQRVDVEATYAMVRTALGRELVGPIVSNRVELEMMPPLAGGGEQRGLASSGGSVGLASGGEQRGLGAGGEQRGLGAGGEQRDLASGTTRQELAAGGNTRGLSDGGQQRALTSATDRRGLRAGEGARALATGGAELPAISLRKHATSRRLLPGREAAFALELVNDSSQVLERVVLVDRVDPRLEVTEAPGASPYRLDDGSTLLVFEDRVPVPVAGRRTYVIRFRARAPGG